MFVKGKKKLLVKGYVVGTEDVSNISSSVKMDIVVFNILSSAKVSYLMDNP